MSIDGSVAPEQALSADNAGFNCFAGLHDRKQRNHATQGKVDAINGGALFVEHDVRAKLHRREPALDGGPSVLPRRTHCGAPIPSSTTTRAAFLISACSQTKKKSRSGAPRYLPNDPRWRGFVCAAWARFVRT